MQYETEWIEYPDIEPKVKALNGKPGDKNADGSPKYTAPFIVDDSSGEVVVVSDSLTITQYLDKTYPSTTRAIPDGLGQDIASLEERF